MLQRRRHVPPQSRSLAAVVAATALLSLGACSGKKVTEIVVSIASDLTIPAQASALRFTAGYKTDNDAIDVTWDLDFRRPDAIRLPAVIALLPGNNDVNSPVLLTARALRAGSRLVVERRARLPFARDRIIHLKMNLLRQCIGVTCKEDETCGELGCEKIEKDPRNLPAYAPDAAYAKVSDGGLDGRDFRDLPVDRSDGYGDRGRDLPQEVLDGRADGRRRDGPAPDGPTPDGPTPDGPTPDGPARDSSVDGPRRDSTVDGPRRDSTVDSTRDVSASSDTTVDSTTGDTTVDSTRDAGPAADSTVDAPVDSTVDSTEDTGAPGGDASVDSTVDSTEDTGTPDFGDATVDVTEDTGEPDFGDSSVDTTADVGANDTLGPPLDAQAPDTSLGMDAVGIAPPSPPYVLWHGYVSRPPIAVFTLRRPGQRARVTVAPWRALPISRPRRR